MSPDSLWPYCRNPHPDRAVSSLGARIESVLPCLVNKALGKLIFV